MSTVAPLADSELLALWLDDDLVEAEFNAMIAAEFPRPTKPVRSARVARRRGYRRSGHAPIRTRHLRPVAGVDGARAAGRERSPPRSVSPSQ